MYVGIDIGGTNLKAGLVDGEGRLLAARRTPLGPFQGGEYFVRRLAELTAQVCRDGGVPPGELEYVGMGVPGAVAGSEIVYTCNIPLKNVPVGRLFSQYLDVPVRLANDADCAAVGEYFRGAGRGTKHFAVVTLGTGVGGGFILNGKLYGGGGMAGEIGHMVIRRDGPACGCGRRGCWEACCSATALIRRTRETMAAHPESLLNRLAAEAGAVDGRTPFSAAERSDPAALALCRAYAEDLAAGVTNLVNLLDPETLAIGGGVAGAPEELLLKPVRELVERECYGRHVGKVPRIVTAELGGDAGLIGAASLRNVN